MAVGKLAHDRNRHGVGERVDGDDPYAEAIVNAERVLDNGTRGVHDAHVECAHAQAEQVDYGDKRVALPLAAGGGCCFGGGIARRGLRFDA